MKKNILIILFAISTLIQAQQATRFMVVSDMHFYSPAPDFKATLLYEFAKAAMSEKVDFLFFTGDLVISGFTTSAEQDSALKDWRFLLDTLSVHNIRVFACRGNNDYSREAWDALFSGNYAFPQNGPEDERNITYAFEYDNLLFIALDQYVEAHRINQVWLDEQLAKNTRPYVFVAAHEPAFKLLHSNCMGAYPDERNIFWESLIKVGVKIFFCGHDHFYDHAVIDDGDGNPLNDVHQIIVGTGGYLHNDANYDGDNGQWTPVRLFHEEANGYALVDIQDLKVRLTWKHRVAQNVFEEGGDAYEYAITGVERKTPLKSYFLWQNYPNPFNANTAISYRLSAVSQVRLVIYDILGRQVRTLVAAHQQAGSYQCVWDGTDKYDLPVAAGVYFCRMEAGNPSTASTNKSGQAGRRFVKVIKLALVR
jgi:predicted phosphodiesterase